MVGAAIGFTIEKAGELVLSKAIEKVADYKKQQHWESLFINTNEFLLKQVEHGDRLIEDIAVLLSDEDIKKVAVGITQESKYLLSDKLHKELRLLMMNYEIPANEAEFYISNFITIIFHELERINPDAFQCAFLGEWKAKEEQHFSEIKKELTAINSAITLIRENHVAVYSVDQIEIDLFRQTFNPCLSLDFFEIDDEVFKEEFEDSLDNECIYVSGQCKEETILCILNELRRIKPDKIALVVKEAEDWKKLISANEENEDFGGKILIPWFYMEQIYAVPNNTNIFVFGEDEHCVGKSKLNLRKRKRSTISKKLIDAGLDYEEAYALINDTHGLYVPLKKKIIRGIYNVDPNWVEGNKSIIIPLLLCGKWTENDGDKMIIEELCNAPYNQVLDEIKSYMTGEDPLFIKFKVHGNTFIHLASTENAWDYLDALVDVESKLWKKYIDIIRAIINEENPVFNFPIEKQAYANILPGGKTIWSSDLKEGLLHSLIMKAYYKNNRNSQLVVDQIVENILNDISSTTQWLSIAELFKILCEASPKAVSKRLEFEWKNETGLKEVFLKTKNEGIFARNDYVHFIWGLEQFLCQREYVAWTIRWFLKMNSLQEKYPINNSPHETLVKVFCAWYNITTLSQKDKISLAEEAFEKGYNIWELIFSELPGNNTSLIGTPSKPKYRIIDEPIQVNNEEVAWAYNEYLNLCLKHMEFNTSRWGKIIEISNHFNERIIETITDKLMYEIQSMNDVERINIKEKIRKEIHRNRYFASSEWAMNESLVKKMEELMNQINVQNEIYEYRYLFVSNYDFPLLNPCPYSENEKREINDRRIHNEIVTGLNRFKEQNLDIISLVKICAKIEQTTLGRFLFEIYTKEIFDTTLFSNIIIDDINKRVVLDYVQNAYKKSSENLEIAVNIAKASKISEDLIINLLLLEIVNVNNKPLIAFEDENTKEQYWKHFRRGYFIENSETAHYVIYELIKYSNQMIIIEVLDDCKNFFNSEEILVILEKIKEREVGVSTQLSAYHLKNLLSVIQNTYLNSEDCERVALLELPLRGLLEISEMKCFLKCLTMSPKLYLFILGIIFKDDNGNSVEGNNFSESQIGNVFSLYYNLKFCPAKNSVGVDKERLLCWIKELEEGLKRNKQIRLLGMILGKILAASPAGSDGHYPDEAVRDVIERYGNQSLENEYVVSISNSRGVYSPTGGNKERAMAREYKENAEAIRLKSPKTAKIFDRLSERYLYEADSERESEEYAEI